MASQFYSLQLTIKYAIPIITGLNEHIPDQYRNNIPVAAQWFSTPLLLIESNMIAFSERSDLILITSKIVAFDRENEKYATITESEMRVNFLLTPITLFIPIIFLAPSYSYSCALLYPSSTYSCATLVHYATKPRHVTVTVLQCYLPAHYGN